MVDEIKVGCLVRIKAIPDWLIHDLPESERREILACIGGVTEIVDIDKFGYYWVGFGTTHEESGATLYHGHSFALPLDCIEVI